MRRRTPFEGTRPRSRIGEARSGSRLTRSPRARDDFGTVATAPGATASEERMRFGSVFAKAVFVVLAGSLALASGCSKSTSPAPNNSGGGTGGPTFNFTFPAAGTSIASPGTSHTFQFTTAGSWNYACNAHGACCNMTGVVIVSAAAPADSAVVEVGTGGGLVYHADIGQTAGGPANSVTIKPNGTVRWANVSSLGNHTVTR